MKTIKNNLFIILTLFAFTTFAQTDTSSADIKDEMLDLFKGGRGGYFKILNNHIFFPPEIKKEDKFGKVFFKITIDTIGKIDTIEILRSFDERANKAVVDALKATEGNWKIKETNGVRESYMWTDYIYFELR